MMNNEQIARGSVLSVIAALDERDAEIERLRGELAVEKGWVQQYRDSYVKYAADADELIDEIERLRTHLSAWERACAGYVEVLASQDAELKKLRQRSDNAVADNCVYLDDTV
jgi:chromosome segregation ATPase